MSFILVLNAILVQYKMEKLKWKTSFLIFAFLRYLAYTFFFFIINTWAIKIFGDVTNKRMLVKKRRTLKENTLFDIN